jgi:hypothetical protein
MGLKPPRVVEGLSGPQFDRITPGKLKSRLAVYIDVNRRNTNQPVATGRKYHHAGPFPRPLYVAGDKFELALCLETTDLLLEPIESEIGLRLIPVQKLNPAISFLPARI